MCESDPSSPRRRYKNDEGYFKFHNTLRKLRNTFSATTLSLANIASTPSSNSLDGQIEERDDFEISSAHLYHEKSRLKKSYKKKGKQAMKHF